MDLKLKLNLTPKCTRAKHLPLVFLFKMELNFQLTISAKFEIFDG